MAATAFAFAFAGCGSAPTSSSSGSLYHQLVAAYVTYAGCARSHGMPNLPDPQVDDQGNDHYPSLDRQGRWSWPRSVLTGCAGVWERVHAIRDRFDSREAARMPRITSRAQALLFARCIRVHGFPSFPDPNQSGSSFVAAMPPGFAKPDISARARAAIDACRRP